MSPSDIPFLQPGRTLMGEIIEIVDPEEEEEEKDCGDDGYNSNNTAGGLLTRSFIDATIQQHTTTTITIIDNAVIDNAAHSKEQLLQKQRQLQAMHSQQNQRLLHKQQKDWIWFHSHHPNLSEGRLLELERLHQGEVIQMQLRQQREQCELMDVVFTICKELSTMIDCERREQQLREDERRENQVEHSTQTDQQQQQQQQQQEEPIVFPQIDMNVDSSVFIPQLTATSAENFYKPVSNKIPPTSSSSRTSPPLPPTILQATTTTATTAVTRSTSPAPIVVVKQAIATTTAQLTPEKKKKQATATIDAPVHTPPPPPVSTTALPNRIATDRQRADEIKAVMRDRSLSREERQRKMAEIKERYGSSKSLNNNNFNSSSNNNFFNSSYNNFHSSSNNLDQKKHQAVQPTMATATTNNNNNDDNPKKLSITEQKRLEIQSVMKDKTLGREAKQEQMAAIKSKYAKLSERELNRKASQDKIDKMKAQVAKERGDGSGDGDGIRVRAADDDEEEENDQVGELAMARQEFARPTAPMATIVSGRAWEESLDKNDSSHSHPSSSKRSNRSSSYSSRSNDDDDNDDNGDDNDASSYEMNGDSNHTGGPLTASSRTASSKENEAGGPKDNVANRWNRAAVKVVTTSMISNASTADNSHRSGNASNGGGGVGGVSATTASADGHDDEESNPSRKQRAVPAAGRRLNKKSNKAAINHGLDESNRSSGVASYDMVFDGPNNQTSFITGQQQRQNNGRVSIANNTNTDNPPSNNTSQSTIPPQVDPLEDIPTERTPIKKLVKKLNDDDPSLTVLKLDGRKKIKKEDWELLFESLEDNCTLTHLSMSRCELSDGMVVPLVLALVENETLVTLRLNNNKGLTDDTARGFIKVFNQSNKTLKKLEMTRTKVTKKSTQKLNEIFEERDDMKNAAKMQDERQKKIKSLLSFSAGDKVASDLAADVTKDDSGGGSGNGDDALNSSRHSENNNMLRVSFTSGAGSKASSKRATVGSTTPSKKRTGRPGSNANNSIRSRSTSNTRPTSNTRGGRGGINASTTRRLSGGGRGGAGGGARLRNPSMRASMTAQQMAQLGGDLANVGADTGKLKEQRKLRGECEVCGQKCYMKTMFKSTPLTIPNAVFEGRCLKCNPM
ncbi:hypothetical protein ACHAXR_006578 [Thalassiosira sp. AJA248-18]